MKLAVDAAYGRAMLAAHILERHLILHVSAWHALKCGSRSEFGVMHKNLSKKPLGEIIRIGKANGAISADDYSALQSARTLRNFLVHEVTDFILLPFFTKQGASDIVLRLQGIAEDFEGMSNEVLKMAELCLDLAGVSVDMAKQRSRVLLKKLSKAERLADLTT